MERKMPERIRLQRELENVIVALRRLFGKYYIIGEGKKERKGKFVLNYCFCFQGIS